MKIPRLRYTEIIPAGDAFHAVLAAYPKRGRSEVSLHCHDYYEWIVVLKGTARHHVNGEDTVLRHGQLILMRPDDSHAIFPDERGGIEYVNVAFPCALWEDSVRATGLQETAQEWVSAPSAICLELTPDQRQSLWTEAIAAVRSYHYAPTRLAFSQFWRAAAGAFAEHAAGRSQPLWLRNALLWAQSVDIENLSLDSLVEASDMSFGHLSRTLKLYTDMTPTEWISEIRVKRAAFLLATTNEEIAAIAFDCGFENLSYFYRRFRQFHGKTPRHYRETASRSLPLNPRE